jgi:hypothetical protein
MAEAFQLKAILSAVDRLSPTLKGVSKLAQVAKVHLGAIGGATANLAQRVGVPLGLLAGVGAAASLAGLKTLVGGFVEAGAALDDMSKRTGLSAEQLQRLSFLAKQSDVSVEGLQGAMSKLNKGLGDAAAGKNKDLAALFAKLKIDPRNVKNAADILPQLADAFQRNGDMTMRARMGVALFGKGYAELLPMLVDGAGGIDEVNARFDKLASSLSATDTQLGAGIDDKMNEVRLAASGLGNVVGRTLSPVISPLLTKMADWIAANRDWLASSINKGVTDLVDALQTVDWEGLIKGAQDSVKSIQGFVESIGGIKVALIGLAVILNAGTIVAVSQLVFAVGSALVSMLAWAGGLPLVSAALSGMGLVMKFVGFMFMTNPALMVIAALVAGAALLIANWDTVKVWFSEFFGWIGEKWQQLLGWVNDLVAAAGDLVGIGGGGAAAAPAGPAAGSPLVGGGGSTGLLGAGPVQRSQANVVVDFQNAPQGMRVQEAKSSSPSLTVNPEVGYRSFAKG